MKRAFPVALAVLFTATSALAQSARELKRELRSREAAAKKENDPGKLCEVAQWAAEKGLAADAKRIFKNVLRMDPEHEGANIGLGNAKWDGKWMPKRKADELRKKAEIEEYKAKGYVEVDDVWVPPDEVEDAKRGVFHHEGDLVTRQEKQALLEGKVRHPDTGQLIDGDKLVVAEQHYYPVGREGRWGDEKAADQFYGDIEHPWVIRTVHGTMLTTFPMERIRELKVHVDRGVERVKVLFGSRPPLPPNRPVVFAASTADEYRRLGTSFGDETSSSTAFLMVEGAGVNVPFQGAVRAGICDASHEGLAPYYIRHAAAMAYLHGKCVDAGVTVPMWFLHSVGGLAGRFENEWDGAHFCRTSVVPNGGARNLKGFLNSFGFNGEMESSKISYNITLGGLLILFAMKGGSQDVTDAMAAVTKGFEEGDAKVIERAIEQLEKELIKAEDEVTAFHQKLLAENKQ